MYLRLGVFWPRYLRDELIMRAARCCSLLLRAARASYKEPS